MALQVPVVHIVFNRPRLTAASFELIRRQQPTDLFVIADGPRPDVPSDVERCAAVRAIVADVDWDCRTHYDVAETNLGLRQRIVSGLDRVFGEVDRAIVLEDDCLPHDDFFPFCVALLDRYRDDERVGAVTGSNFQHGRRRGDGSYYFSKFNHCWGWASWSRAWANNDPELSFWDDWRRSEAWPAHCPDPVERKLWESTIERVRNGQIDSWAYPWMISAWRAHQMTATPNANLVQNAGFGDDASHTFAAAPGLDRPTGPLGPLEHPEAVERNIDADRYVVDHVYGGAALRQRTLRTLPRRVVRSLRYRLSRLVSPRP